MTTAPFEKKIDFFNDIQRGTKLAMAELLTNRDERRRVIENLHRMVRNNTGGNPETARDTLNSFISYKLLEPFIDDLGLPQECKWSYLLEQKDGDYQHEVLFDGFRAFRQNETTRKFFVIAEHGITKSLVLEDIIKAIDRLDRDILEQSDILGDIFENTNSARNASEQGQYFTPREMCKIAIDLALDVKPDVRREDGTLCKFADLFCGSGGLVTTYTAALKSRYGIRLADNISDNPIYCMDVDSRLTSIIDLNMLIHTGVLLNCTHIHSGNTFESRITKERGVFEGLKVDFGISNPPYGGDKGEWAFKYNRSNEEIQEIGIKANIKEYAAVQLYMSILNEGGVAALVLPGGFFTNSDAAMKIREKLTEEYKIMHVVEFPKGTFTNTGCETALIVFQKGAGVTEEVTFWTVDRNENGDVTKREVLKVGLEELRSKNYYLKYSIYMKNERPEYENREFPMVKLGDIVSFVRGKTITKSNLIRGPYPVIGGGLSPMGYHNSYNMKKNSILISQSGENAGHISKYDKKVWASDCFSIKTGDPNILNERFLYHNLISNPKIFYNLRKGTAQKHIYPDDIKDLEIPLPPIHIQNQIADHLGSLDDLIATEEKAIKLLEQNLVGYAELISRRAPYVKLGDICEIKYGSNKNPEKVVNGQYPIVGGGTIKYYTHTPNTEKHTIIVSRSGSCGTVAFFEIDTYVCSYAFKFNIYEQFNKFYIYYILKANEDNVKNLGSGTVQKNINREILMEFKIPYPDLTPDDENVFRFCQDEIDNKKRKIREYRAMIDKFYQIYMSTPLTEDDRKNIVIPVSTPKTPPVNKRGQGEKTANKRGGKNGPTVKELKEQCKALGIKGCGKLNKKDLEAKIAEHNVTVGGQPKKTQSAGVTPTSTVEYPPKKTVSAGVMRPSVPLFVPKVPVIPVPKIPSQVIKNKSSVPSPKITIPTIPSQLLVPSPKITVPTIPKQSSAPSPKIIGPTIPNQSSVSSPKITAPLIPSQSSVSSPKITVPTIPSQSSVPSPKITTPTIPSKTLVSSPKITVPTIPSQSSVPSPKIIGHTIPKQPQLPLVRMGVTAMSSQRSQIPIVSNV